MKKICNQCGVEQRVMDYYRTSAGGFMSVCKACHRANVRANRAANVERYREFDQRTRRAAGAQARFPAASAAPKGGGVVTDEMVERGAVALRAIQRKDPKFEDVSLAKMAIAVLTAALATRTEQGER